MKKPFILNLTSWNTGSPSAGTGRSCLAEDDDIGVAGNAQASRSGGVERPGTIVRVVPQPVRSRDKIVPEAGFGLAKAAPRK